MGKPLATDVSDNTPTLAQIDEMDAQLQRLRDADNELTFVAMPGNIFRASAAYSSALAAASWALSAIRLAMRDSAERVKSVEAQALSNALESVAHWASNNEEELLLTLCRSNEAGEELAEELRGLLKTWRDASNAFLNSL